MKSMMRVVGVLAVFVPAATFAAPPQMEPGLWQRTMTMQGRTFSHQDCVTPDMVKQGVEKMAEARKGKGKMEKNCTHDGSWNGNVYSFESDCKMGDNGTTMKMTGTMTFESPTHFTQVMNSTTMIDGQPRKTVMTIDHKRVGDCAK